MNSHRPTRPGARLGTLLLSVLALSGVRCADAPDPLSPSAAALLTSVGQDKEKSNNGKGNNKDKDQVRASKRPVQGRYIVVFNPETKDVRGLTDQMVRGNGGEVHYVYEHALKGHAATYPPQAINGLLRNPHVLFIEEDGWMDLDQVTQSNAPWPIDRIDQPLMPLNTQYTYNGTGAGVNIYVIDSGIRYTHNEFEGRASLGVDFIGDGVAQGTGDCNGHGTYVAGLAAGKTYGAAKKANLISVRVFDCEWVAVRSRIIAGVDWVTANAVKPAVTNMSLGETDDSYPALTSLDLAVENSVASGIFYAVSAGNLGGDACMRTPARSPSAMTTGATNASDARASFSNFGTCVNIFGPGENVVSASYGGNNAVSSPQNGTSAAAPHVAGVAAMYLQNAPTATPSEVRNAILSQATAGRLTDTRAGSPNLLLYSRITGSTPTPPPAPAGPMEVHTLVDDFAGKVIDLEKWKYYLDPARTTLNDRLIVTLSPNVAGGYGGLLYRLPHGLANSSFLAEVSQAANGGPLTETKVGVGTEDSQEYVAISSMGGKLGAYYKWRGQGLVTLGEIPLDPAAHRFRRLRSQGGYIFYEVSANGSSWTQPSGWSTVQGFVNINSLHGWVVAGTWHPDPNPGVAIFENVNTTVPAIPSGLSAAASQSQIQLSWQDRSVNESGFAIERRVLPGGSFAPVGTVGANVSTYTDAGLESGTSYEYRVRAHNASGNSGYTNTATATTGAAPPPPPPGGAAPAAPSELGLLVRSAARIDLSWRDNSENESGFEVQRSSEGGAWSTLATTAANAVSFSDSGLSEGTSYSYRVRAVNDQGGSSWTETAAAITLPNAPSHLTAQVAGSRINLSWRDNSAKEAAVEIQRSVNGGSFTSIGYVLTDGTSYTDTNVQRGVTYTYRVRAAVDANTFSEWSNTASAIR